MRIAIVGISPIPEEYLAASAEAIEHACRGALAARTELALRVPQRGPVMQPQHLCDYRNPYFQHRVRDEVIRTIVAADREGFDAIVVNCFDDPGVVEARTLVSTPVFGLSEPTFHYACLLGHRLGALVPDMPGQVDFVRRQIEAMGLTSRLIERGVRAERKPFTDSFAEALNDPQPMIERLTAQGRELVDDGADVVVVACGGLGQVCAAAGFHTLEHRGATVPVVVPLVTAVKTAEAAVSLSRALGTPVPSRAHAGRQLTAGEIAGYRAGFGVID